ncbi:hypothetical protein [Vibrio sinaloensis]|uniref:hypothetical protein n=1 Tax=Photobacterium sp. (strain ATCC 43367) TaxID=379097 RepID=UPI002A650D6C|nr:hypothetical protein [Vibrio sinaloensis]
MSAITISVSESGQVSVEYETKTRESIGRRLNQLKDGLGIDWYGVAYLLNMQPNENSVRLMKRWQTDPSLASFQEMPEHKWKLLLTLVEGQEPLKF